VHSQARLCRRSLSLPRMLWWKVSQPPHSALTHNWSGPSRKVPRESYCPPHTSTWTAHSPSAAPSHCAASSSASHSASKPANPPAPYHQCDATGRLFFGLMLSRSTFSLVFCHMLSHGRILVFVALISSCRKLRV